MALNKPWVHCPRPDLVDWESAHGPDPRDPRTLVDSRPCYGQHQPEAKYRANGYCLWLLCGKCSLRLHYVPKHGAPMTSVSAAPTPQTVRTALALLQDRTDDEINGNMMRGAIKMAQGAAQMRGRPGEKAGAKAKAKAPPPPLPKAQARFPTSAAPMTPMPVRSQASSSSAAAAAVESDDDKNVDRWNLLVRKLFRREVLIEAALMEEDML